MSFFDSGAILLTAGAEHHVRIFAMNYDALERKLMTPEASVESVDSWTSSNASVMWTG